VNESEFVAFDSEDVDAFHLEHALGLVKSRRVGEDSLVQRHRWSRFDLLSIRRVRSVAVVAVSVVVCVVVSTAVGQWCCWSRAVNIDVSEYVRV